MNQTDTMDAQSPAAEESPSRFVKIARLTSWIVFSIFCLVLFTILKLPEDRLRQFIQGTIARELGQQGIGFRVNQGKVSIGLGISYVMKEVTLTFQDSGKTTKIDELTVAPSILPLLLGKMGGRVSLENAGGSLQGKVALSNNEMDISFKTKDLNLGKLGVFDMGGVQGSAVTTGSGSIEGNSNIPSTLTGDVNLNLKSIVIDQQSILGFSIPRLSISNGDLELDVSKGKAKIVKLQLGKPGSSDDIQATVSGDILLGRNWDTSTMDLKITLRLSDQLRRSFALLDALLGSMKQPDGSYAMRLSGPLTSPGVPTPLSGS